MESAVETQEKSINEVLEKRFVVGKVHQMRPEKIKEFLVGSVQI